MNIETAMVVVLNLLLGPGMIILGLVMVVRAGNARRRVQLQYADWLHANGHPFPPPFGMTPGTPPSAGDVPPKIAYPPEVMTTARPHRVTGWIFFAFGALVFFARLSAVSQGLA